MKRFLPLFILNLLLIVLVLASCGLFTKEDNEKEEEKRPSKGLEYTLSDDGTYYIVSGIGTCQDNDVVIPETNEGLPVKEIEYAAFYGCDLLTSVTIGDNVEMIGAAAFGSCDSLTSVTIGDNVTEIGGWAFELCTSLTNIIIPDSVTSIGWEAFFGCSKLKSVIIGNGLTSIGDYAFDGCGMLTSVRIPDSLTTMGADVFSRCDSLKYNEYDNACYLGNEKNPYLVLVKAKDTSIASCLINQNTKIINRRAFFCCESLESVKISDSVISIGSEALFGCTSLANIEVNANNETYKSIDGNLYSKDGKTLIKYAAGKNDTMIVIPNGVTSIEYCAFAECTSLTSIVIPNSVTSIGYSAFFNCTSLTIYCEATNQPSDWATNWNDSNCPVVWGHTHTYEDGKCVCGKSE